MNKIKEMTKKREKSSRNSSRSSSSKQSPLYDENNGAEELVVDPHLVDDLEKDTQETLLKTFEYFYEQESETMIHALSESRIMIKHSMVDLVDEQDRMKEKLHKVSEGKYEYKRKVGK